MQVAEAKSLCGACPVRAQCLEGALSRQEPAGVWGGELFEDGRIIAKKRKAGRPSLKEVAARNEQGELIELNVAKSEREESAA
jgi:WhiB family redox-sensing transcriptional regulator